MASYEIIWRASAKRELRRLDRTMVPRIIATVESLTDNPRPPGSRKLQGAEHTYRIRVGTCRIVYEVHDVSVKVIIVRVRPRGKAYR